MSLPEDAAAERNSGGGGLPREGSREIQDGIIVSEVMDWCKSPTAIVGYPIWARQADAANLANSVRLTDDPAHVVASLVLHCYGDEPGVGGGVLSGTHNAECEPLTYSPTVRAENRNMVRHDDLWWMNHKNTYGRLTYVKDPNSYPTPDPQLVKAKMQVAQAATGTMSDAPPIGIGGSSTTQQPPTVSQDMGDFLKGGAKGGPFAAEMGLIGGLPHVMSGSMQRLNAAAAADAQRQRDNLARQQGYKDEADFISAMRKVQADEQAKTAAVRVSGKARKGPCPCLVGRYIAIRPSCKATCGPTAQAHHIVPDKYLRYGTRNAGDRIETSAGSVSYPSLDQGPAICLTGNAAEEGSEHNTAHKNDREIARQGASSPTPGTLDFGTVKDLSVAGAIAARPDCAPQIVEAVGFGFENIDPASLVRSTNSTPKIGSPAYEQLAPKPER